MTRGLVTIFNKTTRIIRKVYRLSNPKLAAMQCQPDEAWVPGGGDPQAEYIDRNWEFRTRGDGGPDDPGEYVAPQPVIAIVTQSDVKAEAKRRLADIDWRVEKAGDRQDREEERRLRTLRETIRDASNKIEAMSPIPHDYRDDRHWPAIPQS